MNILERAIIEISYKRKLSHIGSCLTAARILVEIFKEKKRYEKFVLSSGHCGLSLYLILEQYGHRSLELLDKCGIHPDRMMASKAIDCSTGSLGLGLPIALGMAMADRTKKVYCLVSDGECAEGSIFEALNVKEKYKVDNLIVHCNYNQYGAYDKIDLARLMRLPGMIIHDTSNHWFIQKYGQEAHYRVLTDEDYQNIINAKNIL